LKCTEGTFVYVKNGDHLLRTPVELGPENEQSIQIKDGLLPGDVVVTQEVEPLWLVELQAVKGGAGCQH
jgi:multidrug efflux pump subunit AcrA (membrane-fusion protein)